MDRCFPSFISWYRLRLNWFTYLFLFYRSSDGAKHRLRLSKVNEAGAKTPGRPWTIAKGTQHIVQYAL